MNLVFQGILKAGFCLLPFLTILSDKPFFVSREISLLVLFDFISFVAG